MLKPGMIGFSNNKKAFFGKLIRFFTRANITHSFILTTPGPNGEIRFEEASSHVWEGNFADSYENNDINDYYIYKIKDGLVTQTQIDESLKYCHDEFLGDSYGILQLLYFPYRWFMETFFKVDVRHRKNWFTAGVICSELVYYFLYKLGPTFQKLLEAYNPDTIQPSDIRTIIEANPNLFEFVQKKVT